MNEKNKAIWKQARKMLREGCDGLTYAWRKTSIPGTCVLEVLWWASPCPVGSLWFRFVGNDSIEMVEVFVGVGVRRCGIGRFLLDSLPKMRAGCRRIMTTDGNEDSTPWMEACGFRQLKNGDWVKRVKG